MDALNNLGIDGWSVVLYLVNIGVLLAVLSRFLYKPLLKFLDERRETIRKNITEAESIKKTFQKELDNQKSKTDELVAQMQEEIRQSRLEAEKHSKKLLAEAEEKKDEIISDAQRKVTQMKDKIQQDIEADTLEKIEKIVLTVLEHKVPEKVVAESVKSSWRDISKAIK